MNKIESFQVDHQKLVPGLYLSRSDAKGSAVTTTFDLRLTRPNREPALEGGAMHTIEHLCATFLRNSAQREDIIYFGPMGCRTGFYLVMFGNLQPEDVLPLVKAAFEFTAGFEGEIPGASQTECGNYLYHNLPMAKFYSRKYLDDLEKYKSFKY
jgi:S-ribosylhomocysteine lyase